MDDHNSHLYLPPIDEQLEFLALTRSTVLSVVLILGSVGVTQKLWTGQINVLLAISVTFKKSKEETQRCPLEDFLSCYPINAEIKQDVPTASKANEYFAALADFRRNDEDDVFVPMDPVFHSQNQLLRCLQCSVPVQRLLVPELCIPRILSPLSMLVPIVASSMTMLSTTTLSVNMSKPPPLPTSIASSASGRLRTLNGATVVNGINLANLKQEQPNCRLWHPRELCKYYPKCTLTAEVCGFGHPFCGIYCECDPKKRSLQKTIGLCLFICKKPKNT
uniref:Uncharacterized protein n=1 Tax=Ditylenchus dipsaci TaxID=166011 RepID=A0A915E0Z8_9BILA